MSRDSSTRSSTGIARSNSSYVWMESIVSSASMSACVTHTLFPSPSLRPYVVIVCGTSRTNADATLASSSAP